MSGRVATSRLLIALSIWPNFFGWLFLWSGIGVAYIGLAIVTLVTGTALAWSRQTLMMALAALLLGSAPFIYLLVDIAVWKLCVGAAAKGAARLEAIALPGVAVTWPSYCKCNRPWRVRPKTAERAVGKSATNPTGTRQTLAGPHGQERQERQHQVWPEGRR